MRRILSQSHHNDTQSPTKLLEITFHSNKQFNNCLLCLGSSNTFAHIPTLARRACHPVLSGLTAHPPRLGRFSPCFLRLTSRCCSTSTIAGKRHQIGNPTRGSHHKHHILTPFGLHHLPPWAIIRSSDGPCVSASIILGLVLFMTIGLLFTWKYRSIEIGLQLPSFHHEITFRSTSTMTNPLRYSHYPHNRMIIWLCPSFTSINHDNLISCFVIKYQSISASLTPTPSASAILLLSHWEQEEINQRRFSSCQLSFQFFPSSFHSIRHTTRHVQPPTAYHVRKWPLRWLLPPINYTRVAQQ